MNTYKPLTKMVTDDKGNRMAVCGSYGTDECRIHQANGCGGCKYMAIMIGQLHFFEEILMEGDNKEDENT